MRGVLLLLPLGLLAMLATFVPERARAQDTAPGRDEIHFGAGSCAAQACHGGAVAERAEYKTWATRDRHSKAYEVLTGDLGRRIGERLGIEPTKAAECLNCHGTVGVRTADTFDPADGVSCELCHGGAKEWLGPHVTPEWKNKTPAQKEELGLRDLATPRKRVRMCVQCHVAGEGRDITHRIMAAGHPPLVFDAAKFMDDMPVHWKDETDHAVETWVEGQRASGIALLAHVGRAAEAANGTPDWTVLDCYSCHHPVYAGTVYEKRRIKGAPGQLTIDTSSIRVFSLVAGDPTFLNGLHRVLHDGLAADDMHLLAKRAAGVARTLASVKAETDAGAMRDRLDRYLAGLADGKAFAPRAEMQQLALAVHTFAVNRDTAGYREALAALDEALATTRAYDGAACARLARKALAAR